MKYNLYFCARGALLGDWKEREKSSSDVIFINSKWNNPKWKFEYVPHKNEWLSKVWYSLLMNMQLTKLDWVI